jgi:nicotinate-nucleotide adenylyltransferase
MHNAVGLFGGTFDPVHYGHLRAAAEVRERLQLPELRLVPAGDPPHRGAPVATAIHRLAMLQLAVEEFPGLTVDAREVVRTGKSYTVTTLSELREELPERPLLLIVGIDAFAGLPTWHRWREIFDLAHIVVVTRPGTTIERALSQTLQDVWRARHIPDTTALESAAPGAIFSMSITPQPISATTIRRALLQGSSGIAQVRGLLPAAVLAYIDRNQLYRSRTDAS